MTQKWKFLVFDGERIASRHDLSPWQVGEWRHQAGTLVACGNGFHASDGILDALGYVRGEVLARVEVAGDSIEHNDKSVHEHMRITRAYRWTKADSVALAIFAAELVLGLFETNRSGDERPRKAIEAAKTWLADQSEENRAAAYDAAYAAYATATNAANAAYAAANADAAAAAYAAANAAYAAHDAASAAYTTATNAAYAAYDATTTAAHADQADRKKARRELYAKIEAWLQTRVPELEELH